LYPNEDVAKALEHFWSRDKVVGAICHGAIALGISRIEFGARR
jgi:putative intracellular protease/amidase